ncbi:MAG: hypothetical protein Q9195_001571 [Heterodermia aff. obscurata]
MAAISLAGQGFAPVPELYQGTWANVNQGLVGNYRDILTTYWQQTINHLETETHDYKLHQLPLARIKKVMKADPDVKMISAEAPILFAKGCDIFITELTMRAWIHAEENKRRTLQRSDIASALARSDMFDFLIDIVPREEAATKRQGGPGGASTATATASGGSMIPPQQQGIAQTGQAPGQSQQHHIGGHEYGIPASQMRGQEDYQPQPGVYAPQMSQAVGESYPQPAGQMFEGMYYPPMAGQQSTNANADLSLTGQIYGVNQRPQVPPGAQDPGHHYSRHDGGEGDADAEGERDYDVG